MSPNVATRLSSVIVLLAAGLISGRAGASVDAGTNEGSASDAAVAPRPDGSPDATAAAPAPAPEAKPATRAGTTPSSPNSTA